MTFEPINELTIIGVADPGVANRERVLLRPTQSVNLGQFGMTVGIRDTNNPNFIVPLTDNFFWFPNIVVGAPSWLFLYSGKGIYMKTTVTGSSEPAHVFHWNRDITLFNYFELVPVLFRQSSILIGPNPDRPAFPTLPSLPPVPTGSPFAGLPRPLRP
jgi:hypothetical protein